MESPDQSQYDRLTEYPDDDYFVQPSSSINQNLMYLLLDPNALLKDLEHELRGERFDENTKRWVSSKESFSLLNERGIQETLNVIRTLVNPHTMLSTLTLNEVYMIAREMRKRLAGRYFMRHDEYDIEDISSADILLDKITFFIFASVKRALGGRERLELAKSTQHLIRTEEKGEEEGKKRFGIF